jgi:hypothetical protein
MAPVASFTGDGAYDRTGIYATLHERHPDAMVVAPPRTDAVLSDTAVTAPIQRDRHLQAIVATRRMASAAGQRIQPESTRGGLDWPLQARDR